MAENKKSVILYCDIIHTVEKLDNETAGILFKHYLRYVNDLNPEADNQIVDIVFEPIKQNLKRDLKKYEKKQEQWSEAGKRSAELRNAKKNQRPLTTVKSRSTVSTVNDNVNVNVNDNDNDINNIYNKFVDEVKNHAFDSRIESMYMRLKLKKGSLTSLLKDFKLHIIEENRLHKSTEAYFINFKNWLNTQERIGKLVTYKQKT